MGRGVKTWVTSRDVRDVEVKYTGDGTMDKERNQGQKNGDGEEVD